MTIDVLNKDGKKVSEIDLKEGLFDGRVNTALFYDIVKMQMASRRKGSASTKTRGEVSGAGRKLWRQKGTGRARVGSIRSPLWRHGGTVFGPRPRDYSYTMPKSAVTNGLKSALRHKINEGKLRVFDSFGISEPKTALVADAMKKAGLSNALIVIDGEDKNLRLAARNLKDFKLLSAGALNVYDILRYDELVMTKAAFEAAVSRLAGRQRDGLRAKAGKGAARAREEI
ncbi:MAG: 50S ribosomal protein L4 [Deltaproteobacteria bacterium]|nr:50S ribosomal protein L4 [Deltaproteobacteria bacterium]